MAKKQRGAALLPYQEDISIVECDGDFDVISQGPDGAEVNIIRISGFNIHSFVDGLNDFLRDIDDGRS